MVASAGSVGGSGTVGFLMLRHGCGPAPLIMGLILGRSVEESRSQSMIMFDDDWLRFFEIPIVVMFFIVAMAGLAWPLLGPIVRRFLGGGETS